MPEIDPDRSRRSDLLNAAFAVFSLRNSTFWLFFGSVWLIVGLPILCGGLYVGLWSKSVVTDPFMPVAFIAGGGFATLLGGFVLVGVRRVQRLRKEGMIAEGTVFEVGPSWLTINRVRQWTIRFHYRDHRGMTREGQSGPIPPEEAEAWQVGDAGSIRYDYGHPQRGLWVGKE